MHIFDFELRFITENGFILFQNPILVTLKDFTHIPGVIHNTTVEEIMDIIHQYEADNHLPNQDDEIRKFL